MTAAEFLPSLQSLPRSEKLHLIQLLAEDLARDEAEGRAKQLSCWQRINVLIRPLSWPACEASRVGGRWLKFGKAAA